MSTTQLKHIISTSQFDRKTLEKLFTLADGMEKLHKPRKTSRLLAGKIMAAIFYEPSTRTRLSFETAMLKLGGQVISTENAAEFSSAFKGESIEDTVRMAGLYADVIVLRHPTIGTIARAAKVAQVPIINAGDGAGEHPTQALLDILTLRKECKKIDGLTIGMVGDIKYSRVLRSLIKFLGLYKNITIHLANPPELPMTDDDRAFLERKKIPYSEHTSIEPFIESVDVLYVTRVQKERFKSKAQYEKLKSAFVITGDIANRMKKGAIIMHALPRITEITPEVDSNPRAAYFRQAQNGLYARMALLHMLLK